jgi:hypothetical protein
MVVLRKRSHDPIPGLVVIASGNTRMLALGATIETHSRAFVEFSMAAH